MAFSIFSFEKESLIDYESKNINTEKKVNIKKQGLGSLWGVYDSDIHYAWAYSVIVCLPSVQNYI